MYFGSDTSAKKIKKAYIGVDGTSKLFFSSGFIWKKYYCNETTTYTWDKHRKETNWEKIETVAGRGDTFDILARDVNGSRTRVVYSSISPSASGDINFSGGIKINTSNYGNLTGYYVRFKTGDEECGKCNRRRSYEDYNPDMSNSTEIASYNLHNIRYEANGYNWSKTGTVTSTNKNDYPGLGGSIEEASDGYGYKLVDQQTEYSQGAYISDVEADDPSAYPENGRHTDGYWYVKQPTE